MSSSIPLQRSPEVVLARSVQIALKPATKRLGMHRIFMRSKGRKHVIADGAFERLQVDARPYWLDTDEHHLASHLGQAGRWRTLNSPFEASASA
jgi:hypothetical protein